MKNLSKFEVQELNTNDYKEIQGGFLIALAAVATIIYVAGEMAYMAGRSHGNCD